MKTIAQQNFDKAWITLRLKFIQGKIKDKTVLKLWLKKTVNVVIADGIEELSNPKMKNKLKRQSGYTKLLMEVIHEKDGYDYEGEE